jgi:hypothetical protein
MHDDPGPHAESGILPGKCKLEPSPLIVVPSPVVGGGMMRGSFGPAQININGSSHDPEALATLVQRRIDESMNWRTHDASEYA